MGLVYCSTCHVAIEESQATYTGIKIGPKLAYVLPRCTRCAYNMNDRQYKYSLYTAVIFPIIFLGMVFFSYLKSGTISSVNMVLLLIWISSIPYTLVNALHPWRHIKHSISPDILDEEREKPTVCINDGEPAIGRCALCLRAFCIDCYHYTINGSMYCDDCTRKLSKFYKLQKTIGVVYMTVMITIVLVAYFFYHVDALYLLILLPCTIAGFVFSNKIEPINEEFYEKRKEGMKLSKEISAYVQRRISSKLKEMPPEIEEKSEVVKDEDDIEHEPEPQ